MSTVPREYDPRAIEARWQGVWDERRAFATGDTGERIYVLEMFPYPSGSLHMGNARAYTIGDVLARYFRMQGKNVLHPMGWDALGLPAENQAIREKVAPQVRTPQNIARMKMQMRRLGLGYDWEREFATCEPEYYRWNQWFFVKLYEKGLVYRRQATVNWCPGCATVLANEQVLDGATCWRGHAGVTTRLVPEWAFRITAYAQELLDDLATLTDWPARIVAQQRNWIGRSEGARVAFKVAGREEAIEIFTTRLDTIFGCTYLVLAPEHPLAARLTEAKRQAEVSAFIERMRQTDRIERTAVGGKKEGVFTGSYAVNPYNQDKVPVWLANFVLAEYGTGAVMSVPAHDQRDFEFAQAYGLPIRPVIAPETGAPLVTPLTQAFADEGVLHDSGAYNKLSSQEARQRMAAHAKERGFGEATLHWHLRDWGFSRQRYWGTPIPVVYCDQDGTVPVPLNALPVLLPDFDATALTGTGGAPLAKLAAFVETTCPKCGGPARREVETMDTFVDSTWYYARFASPRYTEAPVDPEAARQWLPIDIYVGGPEHAVMHLLYFRFWTKAMRDLGLVTFAEPARRLITQGMVNALAFRCGEHGYVPAAEYRKTPEALRVCPKCGKPLTAAVEKMSKSKYNGVDPMDLIDKYGADTARLYTLFAAPPEKDLEWSPESVDGLYRFAGRVFRVSQAQAPRLAGVTPTRAMEGLAGADAEVRRAVHRTLAKVTSDVLERTHFNTAIAALMELVNTLHEHGLHAGGSVRPAVAAEAMQLLAQMLAPFAPHLAEEVWAASGGEGLVAHSRWPQADPAALSRDTVRIAVQVNGKLRGQIDVEPSAGEDDVSALARQDTNVTRHLEGKSVRKQIYVPGRLINFVVG